MVTSNCLILASAQDWRSHTAQTFIETWAKQNLQTSVRIILLVLENFLILVLRFFGIGNIKSDWQQTPGRELEKEQKGAGLLDRRNARLYCPGSFYAERIRTSLWLVEFGSYHVRDADRYADDNTFPFSLIYLNHNVDLYKWLLCRISTVLQWEPTRHIPQSDELAWDVGVSARSTHLGRSTRNHNAILLRVKPAAWLRTWSRRTQTGAVFPRCWLGSYQGAAGCHCSRGPLHRRHLQLWRLPWRQVGNT